MHSHTTMVNTFTCDSCGAQNIPTTDKKKLLVKRTEELQDSDGEERTATLTQGMEICGDCFLVAIVKNSTEVNSDTKRKFTWRPNKDLNNTFYWNQGNKGKSAKKKKKEDDE